jgi:3-deoxy-manno-octulosonate cytidylyltransferase (CMP-KDO synthetase)
MSFYVVIPARFASTRLPGKPLKLIDGKPMIEWVYQAAKRSDANQVIVATDHADIAAVVRGFGGEVCLTRAEHESGTDRLQEVASILGLASDAIVVNVQGDEPLIPPRVINQVAENLRTADFASVATLSEPIRDVEDCFNPNIVKVVSDLCQRALYFSRAPIPWGRDSFGEQQPTLPSDDLVQRHIGIYAYRASLLHEFVRWPLAALESVEKLEQLRILANGHAIHVAPACEPVPGGVDTPEDLARVNQWLVSHR